MRAKGTAVLRFGLVLISSALALLASTAMSADPDYTNYDRLFSEATRVDGAQAENLAAQLWEQFEQSPALFIRLLASHPQETADAVIRLLVYRAAYGDLETFTAGVEKLRESVRWEPEEFRVVESILSRSDALEREWAVNRHLGPQPPMPSYPFDPDTILSFILVQRELVGVEHSVDEEFYQALSIAYRLDPGLFARTISSLPKEEIDAICHFTAWTLAHDWPVSVSRSQWSLTPEQDNILRTIRQLMLEYGVPETSDRAASEDASVSSVILPAVSEIVFTTSPLRVSEAETMRVKLTETTAVDTNRTYWLEAYAVRDGVSYLKASGNLTIPAQSTWAYGYLNMTFTSAGPIYGKVKVYSTQGGSLLTEKQNSAPDYVYGKWKITVLLPVNRNYKGTLRLYKADGTSVMSCECLGRSESNASMWETNGNTPTGTATGVLAGPYSPSSSYGPYKVVSLTPVSGILYESGRSGILIHGGDPCTDPSLTWYPLRPTHGCVRISNASQQSLQNNVTTLIGNYHYEVGTVVISEG